MKLFDVLKQNGLFSNEIRARIKNNQIIINNEVVKENIELDIELDEKNEKSIITDCGDFLFRLLMENKDPITVTVFKTFGFENLFGCNIKNDLVESLNKHIFVRTSKKETFILNKKL